VAASPLLRSLGFAAVDWIEYYLGHGPGDVQGQTVEIDEEFYAFIVEAYRLDDKGHRKVRRAFLSRPKGRNKSGLAAWLSVFESLGPCRFDHWAAEGEVSPWGYEYDEGEPVGKTLAYVEALCVATEEGQAGNTYDAIHYLLDADTVPAEGAEWHENLHRDYPGLDVALQGVTLPGKRGFIRPVTSGDKKADGAKSTFIVADETHLWVLPRLVSLHDRMTNNLLKRKIASGWMLETSTMYAKDEKSVAEGTHLYAQQVAEGRVRDRTLLFDHRQASESWNLTRREERVKALREAYGPAAAWMDIDALANAWNDPQKSESSFRRYWLNQPVSTLGSWLPFGAWAALEDLRAVPPGADVVLTLDGSFNGDTTGVLVVEVGEKPHVDVLQAWERPANARPDWRVPVSDVEQAIRDACRKWNVLELAADPYRWQRSLEALRDDGVPVEEFHQSSQRMTPATKDFYASVVDKEMTHSGNAVLARHIGNAVLKEDSRGTRIIKETPTSVRRIDLAVCAVMGLARARWWATNDNSGWAVAL
jgi:phage terminase large subunit-like protein